MQPDAARAKLFAMPVQQLRDWQKVQDAKAVLRFATRTMNELLSDVDFGLVPLSGLRDVVRYESGPLLKALEVAASKAQKTDDTSSPIERPSPRSYNRRRGTASPEAS